jgi:hypothetical protein
LTLPLRRLSFKALILILFFLGNLKIWDTTTDAATNTVATADITGVADIIGTTLLRVPLLGTLVPHLTVITALPAQVTEIPTTDGDATGATGTTGADATSTEAVTSTDIIRRFRGFGKIEDTKMLEERSSLLKGR